MHFGLSRGGAGLLVEFLDEAVEVAELLLLKGGELLLVVLQAVRVLLWGLYFVEDVVARVVESQSQMSRFRGHSSIIIISFPKTPISTMNPQ